ncbi:Transcriptional regulator containing PAS, AAA-type ATPase, and DNA-binding Fis domains [Tissierella praeacuta DSM 18095]|uniref:Transcriptional regulator containing PAS, AAA-type ATPase, and DNA-binding Fis domains n=1 Tax=Tissierella praeacuta DSM 18095 TaxID=1123404 RepID=A0A1M4VPY1_9FIRM|nr:sigma 54-interacting transcriptional regulator [Tissierella praeacuta]SHE71019.1 Transcriptional regulator containing PAS, AAA-type ATPase, and DNA-binding Fis domains [Tissierella praeacuta DSM 18095]SUO98976.1 Transcriptional regulatory protein ZraR [Tissierella praeacuta]
MIDLKSLKSSLANIVSTMANLTNMEYAIFNTNAELVSSTQVYLQRKGLKVHLTSIEEVLNQGNVIVNKPGLMKSCVGCRFVNNCPSTIEILSCIKLNGEPIGVVSLTSFSQEGHNMIEENIRIYTDMLEDISNLISMFAFNENSKKDTQVLHEIISNIIEETEDNYLIVNNRGLLIHWTKGIEELFSYCDLYTQTIDLMFPKDITNWIFNEEKQGKKYCVIEGFKGILYSRPLKIEEDIVGYILKLEKDKNSSNSHIKEDYLGSIISNDYKIENIKSQIKKISNSSSSVLITGDTGTGKEVVAKAIHYTSKRANNPFIPINCANIPDSLFESELFGYEEGAFTGAKKGGKLGLFELANGGSIFLDEIGELPIYLQAKLLRVLQENAIQRLGSITNIPVDIRIIAATNQDLESMVNENKFRADLFYRLNVIPIYLPPLNQRLSDIDILSTHFIEKYNRKLMKNINNISKEALELMKSYSWPGNVRELENTIEYAINMEDTEIIHIESLPHRIRKKANGKNDFKELIAQKEADLIINVLNKHGWDLEGKQKASKELGISIRTLYRKLKELEI